MEQPPGGPAVQLYPGGVEVVPVVELVEVFVRVGDRRGLLGCAFVRIGMDRRIEFANSREVGQGGGGKGGRGTYLSAFVVRPRGCLG